MIWIAHYGVGHKQGGHSGRYRWGSGNRPRQSEGNRTYTKKEIINSGNAKLIKEHANDLTTKQLDNALKRAKLYKEVDALYVDQNAYGKTMSALKTVKDVGVTAVGVITTYDVGASLLNDYAGMNLPIIKLPNMKKK